MEVCNTVQEALTKPIPKKKKCKKAKWLSRRLYQEMREGERRKGKTHPAECRAQRTARRGEKRAKLLSRVRLCDPMDCSLPGSSVHGILQARVLRWIAIAFSRGSSRPRNQTRVSRIAGRRFTVWATREALCQCTPHAIYSFISCTSFPGSSDGKASACNVEDPGLIPGSGRSPGEGNGNPLQHSCLENPMDGGAW